jgi:hypothetical protein
LGGGVSPADFNINDATLAPVRQFTGSLHISPSGLRCLVTYASKWAVMKEKV